MFASEQKAILADASVSRDLDVNALRDVFSFGFIPGDQTLFQKIHRMPPACLMSFKQGRVRMETYWQLDLDSEASGEEKKYTEGDWARNSPG